MARRKLKLWHFAVAIPLVCAMGGYFYSAWTVRQADAEIARELKTLETLGIPTTVQWMTRKVDVGDNAAPIYREAIATSKRIGTPEPRLTGVGGLHSEADWAALRAYVESHAETLKLVEEAAARSDCEWNRQWDQGAFVAFPEYSSLKQFVKLAAFGSRIEAEAGRYDQSFRRLRVGNRVAHHTGLEPTLISQLVAIAGEAIVHAQLQEQIVTHGGNPEFRRRARVFLEEAVPLPSLRRGMQGEVFFVHLSLEQVRRGKLSLQDIGLSGSHGDPNLEERIFAIGVKLPGVIPRAEATILKLYREAIEEMGTDSSDFRRVRQATAKLDVAVNRDDRSLSGQVISIFAPVFAQAGEAMTKPEVQRRLSRCGLELYEARAAKGAFPTALDPMQPWAIDPFSDKPFVYRRAGARFILYSVGQNGKDDGGRPIGSYASGTDDIEFRAPRP